MIGSALQPTSSPANVVVDPPRRGRAVERLALVDPVKGPMTSRSWFLPYYDPRQTVTPAMRQAFKTMMRHPVIKAAAWSKTYAIAALDYDVQPANPNNPADRECAEFHRHLIDRLPEGMPGLVQEVTVPRLIDGYQVAEQVRTVEDEEPRWRGKIVLENVKSKPTELYDLVVDPYANVTGVNGLGPNRGEYWPITDFVYTRHQPVYDNPAGNSDFAAAYQAYWIADTVTKLRGTHAEKFVSPSVVGECGPDDKADMEKSLEALRSRTWAVIPPGAKVQALELAKQGEADFKSFIDDCDKKMLIGITGAYLQMIESGPSAPRGNSQISKSVTELFQWALLAVFLQAVNKQVFPWTTRMNFLGVRPPKLVMGGVTEEEATKIIGNLAGLQNLGYDVSKSDVARRTGYAGPKDEGDKLVRPVTTPTPVGVPGGGLAAGSWLGFSNGQPKPAATVPKPPARFTEVPRDEVALAGPDGRQAARLLGKAKEAGSKTLYYLSRRAVGRMLELPNPLAAPYLFDDQELTALARQFAATNGTANLLGRSRILEKADQAENQHRGLRKYSESDCFAAFADAPPPLPPERAIDYFQTLVPTLDVSPRLFGPMQRREAFTLAARTDQVMVESVKRVIQDAITSGRGISSAPAEIEAILERAGVAPANPQYSEMVFRTNMMDAYNQGAMEELQSPPMRDLFPVWLYLGIDDGRQGEDHDPHFDRYYPNTVSFAEVRGPRVYNCRCSFRAIDRYEWDELQANGARVETSWQSFSEPSAPARDNPPTDRRVDHLCRDFRELRADLRHLATRPLVPAPTINVPAPAADPNVTALTAAVHALVEDRAAAIPFAEPVTMSHAELPTEGIATIAKLTNMLDAAMKPPVINVEVPAPQVTINVPEQPAPQVTVNVPESAPPQVTVNVPEQPAPQVIVEAPSAVPAPPAELPDVQVTVEPPQVTVETAKRQRLKILRDQMGRISGAEITGE